ncbi:MAG: hypothetical protein QOJ51_2015, partial [Acidobacteriaceae bacterium]|nr:hypothetical protein [Acidobacteriaceae bacterium]
MSEVKGKRRKKPTPGQTRGQIRPQTRTAAENQKAGALRRGAISAFILFHLFVITVVAVPLKAFSGVKALVMPYMRWSGLYQSWDMFGPDPVKVNAYVKAVVISRDRHMQVWSFPKMEDLGLGERFRKERYRKFMEVLPQPQYAPLWPDVASHLARSLNNPTDPPDKVLLIEFQSDIHPEGDDSPEPVARPNVFYENHLPPGALR